MFYLARVDKEILMGELNIIHWVNIQISLSGFDNEKNLNELLIFHTQQ